MITRKQLKRKIGLIVENRIKKEEEKAEKSRKKEIEERNELLRTPDSELGERGIYEKRMARIDQRLEQLDDIKKIEEDKKLKEIQDIDKKITKKVRRLRRRSARRKTRRRGY